MLHWRLLSTLARVLLVAIGVGLLTAVILTLAGQAITLLYGAVLVALIAAIVVRRRDLNRAIAIQLQREADEARERLPGSSAGAPPTDT